MVLLNSDGRKKHCAPGCHKLEDSSSQWHTNYYIWCRCNTSWNWGGLKSINCCRKAHYYFATWALICFIFVRIHTFLYWFWKMLFWYILVFFWVICCSQVVASQDWPEVTKYAGLVCAQAHRQELIQDLYKTWHDPQRGTVTGGMIRFLSMNSIL